ncbi:MAG: HepT-like ribonuclease domain-containing protein [Bacteroidia bacterium]
MSERNEKLLIEEMIDSVEAINMFRENLTLDELRKDRKTLDAILMNLIAIGECVNRLSTEFKNEHTAIDWQNIKGLRNRIAHNYRGVDIEILWDIVNESLPTFLSELKKIEKL